MKKLTVDQEKCLGCGTCVSLCPTCFQLGEDNKAEVKTEACQEKDCNLKEVIDSCPVGAISHE